MREYPSLVGRRYGKLVVLEQLDSDEKGRRLWLCQCDCGNTHKATTGNLNKGHTTSCGCKRSPDLTGQRFDRLTVLGRADQRNSRGDRTTPMWECRCSCGNITYKATDTLRDPRASMCSACSRQYGAQKAREGAGYLAGTQVSKLVDMRPSAANSSGVRGVTYDKKGNSYRARLNFQGKMINLGSYTKFEDAVRARREAEEEYFGTFLEMLK